jgi:hypothetical protein
VLYPTRSSRPGHLYIGVRRGRCRADWKWARLNTQVYFRHTPISTNFTFEFIRRPISPILSPSSRTFAELTLVRGTQLTGSINYTLVTRPHKFPCQVDVWIDPQHAYTWPLRARLWPGCPHQSLMEPEIKYTRNWGAAALDDFAISLLDASMRVKKTKPHSGYSMAICVYFFPTILHFPKFNTCTAMISNPVFQFSLSAVLPSLRILYFLFLISCTSLCSTLVLLMLNL